MFSFLCVFFFFFFNDTATTEIYTLSLHDALPIYGGRDLPVGVALDVVHHEHRRSEEHTSELQSPVHLVCRLLLEKKKKQKIFSFLYVIKQSVGVKIYVIYDF